MNAGLREAILELCASSRANVNEVTQALVSALQIVLINVGPDADAAEQNIHRIADDMLRSIRADYAKVHAAVEKGPLQ